MSTVTATETMYSIIGRIAGLLASPGFPTADRAVLRRISPDQPLPLTFYRFAVRHLPEGWDLSTARLRDWATIVAGMAIMSPNAHRPDVGLGRALSEAGFSEARLERLLQSADNTRRTLLLRAARFLAAKNQPCNWVDGAWFLLTPDHDTERREEIHRRIARDFYAASIESER